MEIDFFKILAKKRASRASALRADGARHARGLVMTHLNSSTP